MKHTLPLFLASIFVAVGLVSCSDKPDEKKPVGPTTETSQIPWNVAGPGQGMGQFGMMPQNQYRR